MHPSKLTRRRFFTLSGATAAGALLAHSIGRACPIVELPPSEEAKKLADGINAFAVDLHGRLARDQKDTLFFSPLSISAALAMTSAGAKGETLAEMAKTLHLPKDPHPAYGELLGLLNGPNLTRGVRKYELSVANAIWAQFDFPWKKEFKQLTQMHYGAGLVETNFYETEAARRQINAWVEKETKEKIKNLIGEKVLSSLTRMVLTNAIYFKGDWQVKFEKKHTKDSPFTRADGTKAEVPLMNLTSEFNYGTMNLGSDIEEPNDVFPPDVPRPPIAYIRPAVRVQVLELPYAGNDLSMLVYLPESPAGANRLANLLAVGDLGKPALTLQKVVVSLPRFKAESSFSLKPALVDLGMKKAFGVADFTGMSPRGKDLFISAVVHKAFVDVNEEGSEAAAATGVVIDERVSEPLPPVVFRADRPFVFTIRENKTGAVLFMGRYSGPKV